jgi:hypothetical protein
MPLYVSMALTGKILPLTFFVKGLAADAKEAPQS